nr:hypothetical protein Iba_chr10aCG5840 [Ipomoea batatas]
MHQPSTSWIDVFRENSLAKINLSHLLPPDLKQELQPDMRHICPMDIITIWTSPKVLLPNPVGLQSMRETRLVD